MKLEKKIILCLIILLAIIFVPGMVNAAYEDTFTTGDGIVAKKVVEEFTQGNIEFRFSNITLDNEKNYVWALATTSNAEEVTDWYVLGDFSESQKTATINCTVSESKIRAILRTKNKANLFIKCSDDNTIIVNALEVDLTLPILYAFDKVEWLDNWYIVGGSSGIASDQWAPATYNIKNVYYKFEKIANEELVNKYKTALKDGTDLTTIFTQTASDVEEITGWSNCAKDYNYPYNKIEESKIPTDQGAYYLWLKAKDTDSKTVYGLMIVNIDGDGPKVEEIRVTDPEEGTYNTPQTVTIRVYFDEPITGVTVPTLKIKFGNSAVREISTGTIKNNAYSWGYYTYIEYKYHIQDSDVGQLATVDYTGGNIKDVSGNDAVLSCPVITGNAIKANVDGTTTNNTDNQDQNNDQTTTPDGDNNNDGKNDPEDTNNGNDNSQYDGDKIPQTGEGILAIVIIALVGIGIVLFKKNMDYKEIK